jgi:hypothetical protein
VLAAPLLFGAGITNGVGFDSVQPSIERRSGYAELVGKLGDGSSSLKGRTPETGKGRILRPQSCETLLEVDAHVARVLVRHSCNSTRDTARTSGR